MTNIDWFSFENRDYDFPFYRKNPHVPKLGWIVMFVSVVAGLFLQFLFPEIIGAIIFCAIPLLAVLHYLKWDIKSIIRKPAARDVA